ncbi:hypothetical protein A2U01_0011958, partial [Trifolium medium]|nr:hypothetical protein [Trifolium medium]
MASPMDINDCNINGNEVHDQNHAKKTEMHLQRPYKLQRLLVPNVGDGASCSGVQKPPEVLQYAADNNQNLHQQNNNNGETIPYQQYQRNVNPKQLDFDKVPIWVQFWGLPIHCKTISLGQHLGSQIGQVEEAALYDYPEKACIVKVKVQINIADPIRAGIFIGNAKDGITWVDFRYEHLPMFCFTCGLIGHNEELCEQITEEHQEGEINLRGPWLRSNNFGRRIIDKEKKFSSNPLHSLSGGQFSLIPKAMLSLEEEEEEDDGSPRSQPNNTNTGSTGTEGQDK